MLLNVPTLIPSRSSSNVYGTSVDVHVQAHACAVLINCRCSLFNINQQSSEQRNFQVSHYAKDLAPFLNQKILKVHIPDLSRA